MADARLKKLNLKLGGSLEFEYDYSGKNNVVKADYALHLHDKIEIIVLLREKVNFMVEGEVYSLSPYDALVIKPNALHHCVGSPGEPFEYVCCWLDFDCELFNPLLNLSSPLVRQKNERNLNEMRAVCDYFCGKTQTETELSSYAYVVRLIDVLCAGGAGVPVAEKNVFLQENALLSRILKDVNLNFAEIPSASALAERHFISLSTLNRLFSKFLRATPGGYLKARRLSAARGFLLSGVAISDAAERAGYSCESNFIRTFKSTFGYTPGEYKKNYEKV